MSRFCSCKRCKQEVEEENKIIQKIQKKLSGKYMVDGFCGRQLIIAVIERWKYFNWELKKNR